MQLVGGGYMGFNSLKLIEASTPGFPTAHESGLTNYKAITWKVSGSNPTTTESDYSAFCRMQGSWSVLVCLWNPYQIWSFRNLGAQNPYILPRHLV